MMTTKQISAFHYDDSIPLLLIAGYNNIDEAYFQVFSNPVDIQSLGNLVIQSITQGLGAREYYACTSD